MIPSGSLECLVELLVAIVERQPNVCQAPHVGFLLRAYSATRSATGRQTHVALMACTCIDWWSPYMYIVIIVMCVCANGVPTITTDVSACLYMYMYVQTVVFFIWYTSMREVEFPLQLTGMHTHPHSVRMYMYMHSMYNVMWLDRDSCVVQALLMGLCCFGALSAKGRSGLVAMETTWNARSDGVFG